MNDKAAFQIHRYYNGKRNKKYELHCFLINRFIRELGYNKLTISQIDDCDMEEEDDEYRPAISSLV